MSNTKALVPITMPSSVSFAGSDTISQMLFGVALVAALYFTLAFSEYIYSSYIGMYRDRVELFPNTYAAGSKMYTAIQNPLNPKAKTVNFSDNQRSGVEFSYSLFMYVNSDTFSSGKHYLYHVLHKGYSKPYPLMGPGIFMWGDKNTMRVYMNCFDTWDNYTDIDNIPIDKWIHVTVSCKGNYLYIYINGNLKNKYAFSGKTPAYQNYGDIYAFSPRKMTINLATTASLARNPNFAADSLHPATSLVFDGSSKGYISRVFYFSYALTYTEIQSMMNMGPSTVMDGTDMSISPYLADTWWTQSNK